MHPPRFGKRRGYTPVTWVALVALLPMSIFLGLKVRAVFFLPGVLSLVFLVLGVVNRRRGDDA
jgi:hypothetical protein